MSEPPNVPATDSEASSNVRVRGRGDRRRERPLLVWTAVVGVAVVAFAVIAAIRLGSTGKNSDWFPVYQDVLKTSFQALAIGALGGLAKLIFDQRKAREAAAADQRKAREAAADELRDRRYRFISTLVEVSHDIDTAKLVIRANRSVKSWTDMVNDRIIPARSRLGDMIHQLSNWADAGLPVFDDIKSGAEELNGIDIYLGSLLDEYGENKQALGELQLKAEHAKTTSQDKREQLLNQIWQDMQGLPVLGDLLRHDRDPGSRYDAYRTNYVGALLMMRRSLGPKKAPQSTVPVSSAQGVTTPFPSDHR